MENVIKLVFILSWIYIGGWFVHFIYELIFEIKIITVKRKGMYIVMDGNKYEIEEIEANRKENTFYNEEGMDASEKRKGE